MALLNSALILGQFIRWQHLNSPPNILHKPVLHKADVLFIYYLASLGVIFTCHTPVNDVLVSSCLLSLLVIDNIDQPHQEGSCLETFLATLIS